MKSKAEAYRLVWALAGSLTGLVIGFSLMTMSFNYIPRLSEQSGLVPLLLAVAFCGGGLLGGGYLALTLVARRQRAGRKKYFEEKKLKRKKARH